MNQKLFFLYSSSFMLSLWGILRRLHINKIPKKEIHSL